MQKYFLYILLFINGFILKSQTNLVPNPSFEVADNCPTTADQMSYCQSWSSYCESPDYFNTCNATGLAPPNLPMGYQKPLYGNAFAGFITWETNGLAPNYREIIGAQLTSTLSIGTKYYFSFFVSNAGYQNYTVGTDKIGLKFSTVPYSETDTIPINNYSNYYETTILKDTVNWIQLKGSFIADSAYKYIAMGNFFDDAHTDTISFGIVNYWAYYFIDNVMVSTDSVYAYTNSIQQINKPDLLIYPNPTSNKIEIQNSQSSHNYKLLTNLGEIKKQGKLLLNSSIDVSEIEEGIYILQLDEMYYYKILISR